MSTLTDFLRRNSALVSKPLPLVHTCQSYSIKGIISESKIKVQMCDVFKEKLNYFFVGRPAYKKELGDEAAEWELPTCFVFTYDIAGARRVYPFDSGAFRRGMLPTFIDIMNIDDFEMSTEPDGPSRVIGTFFGTPSNYFRLRTIDEDSFNSRYSLGALDAEIRALHRLILKTNKRPDKTTDFRKIDDRRFTIEVQFDTDKMLKQRELLAVIMPEPYLLEPKVVEYFRKMGTRIISYQTHPLNPDVYYGIIYQKIYEFFRSKNLL